MNQAPSQPCSAWAARLAARHPSDLSPAENAALQAHLQNCPACTSTYTAYALMETAIRQLPPVAPLEQFEEANTASHLTNEPIKLPIRARSTHSRHARTWPSRTTRVANLLAAVLVVAVLIAGSVVLFTHHVGTTQVGQQGNFDLPPQAIPANFCAQAQLDPGLQNLCERGQLTKIDMTKNVGGVPVTIAYAYADGNRVAILAFAPSTSLASSPSARPDSKQIVFDEITTTNGQSLDGIGGGSAFGGGKYAFFTAVGDTAMLPSSTRTLSIRASVVFSDASQATATVTHQDSTSTDYTFAPGQIHTTTVTFDFSVPFHPARIAYPHQTITVDGQSITLDRVNISPSEARVYVHGGPKVPGSPTVLKVGNVSTDDFYRFWQPSTRYTSDADFGYAMPLYDQQGEWTFTITPPGPDGGKLTYTFHFVVPPQP